ncbi:MAG: carbohydrate ABC transporter permease [Thermomicrobiales bacterium]
MSWLRLQRRLAPYLFIAPFFIGYAIFWGYPVLDGFWMSLFSDPLMGGKREWIGLGNYRDLLDDDRFWHALQNTTLYALGSIFLIVPAALVIALVLNVDWLRFRTFWRMAFLLPALVGAAVIAIMFVLVFDENYGVLNTYALTPLGLPAIGWLRDPNWALPAIILLGLWRYVGINSLYFLVGLSNIPKELYEAAAIDGASRWQMFRSVTLPLLRPVTLFVVTIAIIGSYKLFAEPLILFAGPGPSDAAMTIMVYLYLTAFQSVRFGYAAAIGYSLVVIIAVLSLLQLRLFGAFRED